MKKISRDDRDLIAGIIVVSLGVLVVLGLIFSIAPYLIMISWNYLIPIFWAGAPILGFWHSVAGCFLLTIIAHIFSRLRK